MKPYSLDYISQPQLETGSNEKIKYHFTIQKAQFLIDLTCPLQLHPSLSLWPEPTLTDLGGELQQKNYATSFTAKQVI